MKQIKKKRISTYLRSQFEEIVSNYTDEGLIKERAGLKPFLYYNGPRNLKSEFLPEFYAVRDISFKKTSHLIELPEFVKSSYYSCVVYVSPENLPNLLERIGYSIDVANKLREKENYYNIFKLNHYGERRNVHDVSFALIENNVYSESELQEVLKFFEKNYNISAKYIPVIRVVEGKRREFLELNFDLSNFYFTFENSDFEKFKNILYSRIISVFPDFEKLTLVQADGQDIALSKSFSKTVYSVKNKDVINDYERLLLDYVQLKGIECVPLSIQEIDMICAKQNKLDTITHQPSTKTISGYNFLEKAEYLTVDDEYYRTMLYYLYKGPKRKGLTIEDYIGKKFDSSINRVLIRTCEGNYSKISIAINRNQEHEFALKLPLMCDFWSRAGVDKNNQNILYRNYYGELRDPHYTPFALIKDDYDSAEVLELLKELTDRYNFSYTAFPTKRTIQGNIEEFSEINVNWFANSDTAKMYLSNFDNAIPLLSNLDSISRAKCVQNEVEYYPVYANGQLK